jgi:two-component system NarL family sensor kinase
MKYITSFILGFLLGWLLILAPVTSFPHPVAHDPSKYAFLKDSIKKLDSLVQKTISRDPAQCLRYSKKALNYARGLKSPEELIHAYSLMGQAFFKKDKDSSYIYFKKSLDLADSTRVDAPKPFILYNLANLYYAAKNYQKAISLMDSSIAFSKEQNDFSTMSRALNAIGNIYIDINNHDDALKMYDSAYEIAKKHSIPVQTGISLANVARFEKDQLKAFKLNKEAIGFLTKSGGNEEGLAKIYINMGYRSTDPDTALFYFRQALRLAQNYNMAEAEMGAYNNMVYSYLDKGNIIGAEECLIGHAIPLAQREKNHDWLATLSDTYAEVLTRKGDYKAAASWQKTAMEERVRADKGQASEQVRLLGVLLDLKSKELTIHDNQREIIIQQNRLQKTRLGLTITIFMIVGFVFIILWLQQRTRVKLQVQQIQSAKRIIDMEENEKAKIARELHDITGQLVLGITGEIENLEMPDNKIKMEIQGKIKNLGKSIRLISHRMNKAMLDSFTFEELVIGQCEDIKKALGLQVEVQMPDEPIVLNEEVVLHAYRIVQELLTNAGKYARDSYVSLSFQKSDSELVINYFDNGPGFDPGLIEKKGMGLMNIFERAKLMKGSAEVTSSPGDGTSWVIKFPLVLNKIKTA